MIKLKDMCMKNRDRIFVGVCLGIYFGIIGMATGSFLAFIFNKIVGSGMNGKKTKRIK